MSFGFSSISHASDPEPDLKTWLEEGESWLCERHYVLDIPDREDDFCWECYLEQRPSLYNDISPNPYILDSLMNSPYFFSSAISGSYMTAVTEGWTTSRAPYHDSSGFYRFRLSGSNSNDLLYAGSDWLHFKLRLTSDSSSSGNLPLSSISSVSLYTNGDANATLIAECDLSFSEDLENGWIDFWLPFTITANYNIFQIRVYTNASVSNYTLGSGVEMWWDVDLTTRPDGGGPGGGGEEPVPDETIGKTWLGGLIDSIIQGINKVIDGIVNLPSSIASALSGALNAIKNAVTSIGTAITNAIEVAVTTVLDGLKELFIPSEGYFSSLFDRLNTFFSERFGLLYFPIEHLLSVLNRILTLTDQAPQIAIPEISYEGEVFIPAMVYTFDFLADEPWSTVHGWYLVAMDVAMVMCVVRLLQSKYEEVFKT